MIDHAVAPVVNPFREGQKFVLPIPTELLSIPYDAGMPSREVYAELAYSGWFTTYGHVCLGTPVGKEEVYHVLDVEEILTAFLKTRKVRGLRLVK